MKNFLSPAVLFLACLLLATGCVTEPLPSEDIEVLTQYADIISVLRNPKLPPNSKEKYEAARKLIKVVDLHYTRETKTVNDLLFVGDAKIDDPTSDKAVFTFEYRYMDHFVRMRFFTYKMVVLRVEVVEE